MQYTQSCCPGEILFNVTLSATEIKLKNTERMQAPQTRNTGFLLTPGNVDFRGKCQKEQYYIKMKEKFL